MKTKKTSPETYRKLHSQFLGYEHQASLLSPSVLPASAPLLRHGDMSELSAANEARLNETYFNQALTDFAVGFRDSEDNMAMLDFIAPPVQAARRFTYRLYSNTEEYYADSNDERSIGADFQNVEYTGQEVLGQTTNRGLNIRVDSDAIQGMDNWREVYTQRILRRLMRSEFKRAVAIMAAAATNTAKTWDTTALKDPTADVRARILAGATAGVRPNCAMYGDTAFDKHKLSHDAQQTSGGFRAGRTTQELAASLGLDRVEVSRARFSSSTTTLAEVVNNLVLLFNAQAVQIMEDASNLKRFWSPCDGGTRFRVYEHQASAKVTVISVEHYSAVKLCSALGLQKLTIS